MKKKAICTLLCLTMVGSMIIGCGSTSGSASTDTAPEESSTTSSSSESEATSASADDGEYDLTIYSIMTTNENWDQWLADVEEGTGLKINAIAAPTDSDTRQQKITTMLSTGDTSVDIIEINDEMSASFKNSGWLEPLNDTVMTDDVASQFAQGYVGQMITSNDGNIIGVPGYTGYLAFWVNQEILDEVGISSIDNKDDFMAYMKAASNDNRYGYGGSWEKTYVFNEIAQFVNMFGGDYYDWTNPANKEALEFMHDLVADKYTPVDQISDKYEQMNPKAIDGKYGCWFYWGTGSEYASADMLDSTKIHQAMVPSFSDDGQRYIFTDSWSYVMNSASEHKDAAVKFLNYMANKDGMEASYKYFSRYPARADVANEVVPDSDPAKEMYSQYAAECNVTGRPMLPQTMEFISAMGTIFQSYVRDDITIDDFLTQAQGYVEQYQ